MPKISEHPSKRVLLVLPEDEFEAVDLWRGRQPGVPNRSEAIRRLIRRGLEADHLEQISPRNTGGSKRG